MWVRSKREVGELGRRKKYSEEKDGKRKEVKQGRGRKKVGEEEDGESGREEEGEGWTDGGQIHPSKMGGGGRLQHSYHSVLPITS